jgi:hypothetical protein
MVGRRGVWGAVMLLSVAACGGDAPPAEEAPATVADAMQQMQGAMEQMAASSENVVLVPAEQLQNRLPTSVDGMDRVDTERSQGGAMGFNMSTATARYEDAGGRTLSITITDVGKAGLLAGLGAAWSMVDVDRVTSDGYERTVTINGNRGFETERKSGDMMERELSVIAGNRLMVQLDGSNVPMDVMRRTLDDLRASSLVPKP